MKKIKKIQIRVNGKVKSISDNYNMLDLVKNLKIPMKKVAIELNQEIIDKKNRYNLCNSRQKTFVAFTFLLCLFGNKK